MILACNDSARNSGRRFKRKVTDLGIEQPYRVDLCPSGPSFSRLPVSVLHPRQSLQVLLEISERVLSLALCGLAISLKKHLYKEAQFDDN